MLVEQRALVQFNKHQENYYPKIRTASRTDRNVHALRNAFTFDASHLAERKLYSTRDLLFGMNRYLRKNKEDLILTNVYQCRENNFDCRGKATERYLLKSFYRTYRYLIQLVKGDQFEFSGLELMYKRNAMLVEKDQFDLQKLEEACQLFVGKHRLKNFCAVNVRKPDDQDYVRTINSITVTELKHPLADNLQSKKNPEPLIVVEIKAKSFLWHQIRIMMNQVVRYAKKQCPKQELLDWLHMDEEKIKKKYKVLQKTLAPAEGLYLMDIKYDLQDVVLLDQ